MILTLMIEGKEKTFSTSFVKARIFREVLDFNKRMDFNNLTPEHLDDLIALTCELYNNQFTLDELYDGLDVSDLIPTIKQVLEYVAGSANRDDTGKQQPTKSQTS